LRKSITELAVLQHRFVWDFKEPRNYKIEEFCFVGIVIKVGLERSIVKPLTSVIYFVICHDGISRCLQKGTAGQVCEEVQRLS
jgi:hypothetical protein